MKALKSFLLFFILPLLFAGCTPRITSVYNLNLGGERIASIGDIFFDHEEGWNVVGDIDPFHYDPFKFDLTIVELTDQKIGLRYAEYIRSNLGEKGGFGIRFVWLIKAGFNKRFDYVVADKVVRFKDYEFDIVSVEKGQIKYKRIK